MTWNFAFETCHGRGALIRFLVVLILIETKAVLIMNVSPGVNIFIRWVFNFCLFFSWYWRAQCLILGGELNMTWFNI